MSLDASRLVQHGPVISGRAQPAAKFHRQLGQHALDSGRTHYQPSECDPFTYGGEKFEGKFPDESFPYPFESLNTNIPFLTIMARDMPLIGRGLVIPRLSAPCGCLLAKILRRRLHRQPSPSPFPDRPRRVPSTSSMSLSALVRRTCRRQVP